MVASQRLTDDLLCYATRLADCLGRSGIYDFLRVSCDDLSELEGHATRLRPSAVIVADFLDVGQGTLATALSSVVGIKVFLADNPEPTATQQQDGLLVMARDPIIPYYTPIIASQDEPPSIMLIGFAARESNLEEIIAKIDQELPEAVVYLEVPDSDWQEFEARVVSRLGEHLADPTKGLRLNIASLPVGGDKIIRSLVENRLTIFYNDPKRTHELESASSLAMTNERAVAFTCASPFPCYRNGGTYIEDLAITDIMELGMAAQIKLCHEFGEWQLYAKLHRQLYPKIHRVLLEQLADMGT